MSTQHTPGPWFVHYAKNGLPYRIISPSANDCLAGKVGTAITRWGAITLPSSEEGKANARLIAAAPELLEALESALVYASHPVHRNNAHAASTCVKIKAAIAKAKGGEP